MNGVTVVTQRTYELQRSMQSRGWIELASPPHDFALNADGTTRAQGIR